MIDMMTDPFSAPLPRVFSTSQIVTYGKCPRQYCYRYVLRIPSLVKTEAMEIGSRVHDAIATGAGPLPSEDEQDMVRCARSYCEVFPRGAVYETTFEDDDNPGRLYGDVCGRRFIGIFDVHWPSPAIAIDWKTGSYKPKYTVDLETQAYILGELYNERYDHPLEKMLFIFLRTNTIHEAKALAPSRSRTTAVTRIEKAIDRIEARAFDPRRSPLCSYCDHAAICRMDLGFTECS